MAEQKKRRVTLVRGLMGKKPDHRATVRGLGLKWRMHYGRRADTPQTRGMINKIGYMLRVDRSQGLKDTTMRLNTIKPAAGSKKAKRRVGRGIGSGLGKTAGRGHKGQKSRSGGFHKVGFEGGQMPLQRRLPKRGFMSRTRRMRPRFVCPTWPRLPVADIDLLALKAAGLVHPGAKTVKVIKTGELKKAVKLTGVLATKGARAAIEAAGGSIA